MQKIIIIIFLNRTAKMLQRVPFQQKSGAVKEV